MAFRIVLVILIIRFMLQVIIQGLIDSNLIGLTSINAMILLIFGWFNFARKDELLTIPSQSQDCLNIANEANTTLMRNGLRWVVDVPQCRVEIWRDYLLYSANSPEMKRNTEIFDSRNLEFIELGSAQTLTTE